MDQRFRNRDRRIGRNPAKREPKHRILVVCEGRVTEPEYFKALQHAFRNPLVHVQIHNETGVPMTVVNCALAEDQRAKDEAKASRDDNLRYDEVWCVFDVDDHPRLDEALSLATASGLQVALSNPCFELWALLHFRDQSERLHRRDAQHTLKQFLPRYEKKLDFHCMHAGYEQAVGRAADLQKKAEEADAPNRNPTTTVYRLTERIKTGG